MTTQDTLVKIDANDPNLKQQQEHLENLSRGLGIEQYRKNTQAAIQSGRESTTSYGQTLMMCYVGDVAKAIQTINKNSTTKGKNHLAKKYFEAMEPEALAFLALRAVIDSVTKKDTLTNVAAKLGSIIELEINTHILKERYSEEYQTAKLKLKKATTARRRKALIGNIYNRIEIKKDGIDRETKVKLGVRLIEIVVRATGLVEIEREVIGKNRHQNYVNPTEELSKWIQDKNAHCELLSPMYLPCVIPPKPWKSLTKGGYHSKFHKNIPMIKTKGATARYRERLATNPMPKVYQAINTLQSTQWKINKDVYAVMSECFTKNIDVGNALVSFEDHSELECPACGQLVAISRTNQRNTSANHECFTAKDEDGNDTPLTKDWKSRARDKHNDNIAMRSKRLTISKVLWVTDIIKDFEAIYFPHNMDFRGRVYPIPSHLQPQGADYSKGLLTFSRGKPIEDEPARSWLAIQGANTYGKDKIPFAERLSFIGGLEDEIRATVEDPISNRGFWTTADKPWQFLAFCFEWVGYLDAEAKGETYVSHLPIAMDGSCSGIQHFSAMLRDKVGGKAVNLVPMDTPQDIYQDVCDKVKFTLLADARGGYTAAPGDPDAEVIEPNQYAKWLLTLPLDRKATKRQVMTVPYGLTQRGCNSRTNQYLKDLKNKLEVDFPWPKDEHWETAVHLGTATWGEIGETVVGAKLAMSWLQDVVRFTCKAKNVPIVWNTPMDLPVMQCCRKYESTRLKIYHEGGDYEVLLREEVTQQGVKINRMKTGVAPNFVHSMDASHLVLTVCDALDSFGIEDFAAIHDSFGTHAASAEDLASSLRDTFVNMYETNDVLGQFEDDMIDILGFEEFTEDFPKRPNAGILELADIRKSQYFFA